MIGALAVLHICVFFTRLPFCALSTCARARPRGNTFALIQTEIALEWEIEKVDVLESESDSVARSVQPISSDRRRFVDTIEPLGVVTYRVTLRR